MVAGPLEAALLAAPAVYLAGLTLSRLLVLVRIEGGSMLPTFQQEDVLLAIRRSKLHRVVRGAVVVARLDYPNMPFVVKRVAHIPGERYEDFDASKEVCAVPEGTLYLRGDAFTPRPMPGLVPTESVAAVVVLRVARRHRISLSYVGTRVG